jgi:hypothetical protein
MSEPMTEVDRWREEGEAYELVLFEGDLEEFRLFERRAAQPDRDVTRDTNAYGRRIKELAGKVKS